MIFSSSANKTGIVEEIDFLLDQVTDGPTIYPIAQKTRNINRWYDRVVSLILEADGRWEYDDSNQTDLPIATTNLVSGQRDYGIAGATFLRVLKVVCKDSSGTWRVLKPISKHDRDAINLLEDRNTGTPLRYDKLASSIFLDPEPNYASTAGLKVYFQRSFVVFAVTDTTKVPGFSSLFHRLLSLGAAYDFALAKGMNTKMSILRGEIDRMEVSLLQFYANRGRDEKVSLKVRKEDYGANHLGGGGDTDSSINFV